jgi:microcystin-dependent protein
MAEPFPGQITAFPYGFAPQGWADCAGQLLPITQYPALFSLLGTAYGGNGQTNFALPDLQGRVPICQGQSPGGSSYDMGETGGAEAVTMTVSELPPHSHSLSAVTAHGTTNAPAGQLLAAAVKGTLHSSAKGNLYAAAAADSSLASASIQPAGGSQPHNNIQPSLVVRYCIALQGIFPSRS